MVRDEVHRLVRQRARDLGEQPYLRGRTIDVPLAAGSGAVVVVAAGSSGALIGVGGSWVRPPSRAPAAPGPNANSNPMPSATSSGTLEVGWPWVTRSGS